LGSVLRFQEDQGLITFKGNRFLLIDAEAMGLLRREIIGVLGPDMARRLLTRYGYACGYSDALRLRQDYAWETDEEWMMAGPMMHMLEGIVQVLPTKLDYSRSEDRFCIEGEWVNSYEAQQHIAHLGHSESATCWTLSGYASGYSSAFFGQPVVCVEYTCVGKGDPHCLWRVGRPHQMSFEAHQALKDLQGFNLAGTINMLEEQITARTVELSALNAASLVLAESLSLDELLYKVLPHVLKATGADFGRVLLLEDESDTLELRVQTERDPSGMEVEPLQLHFPLHIFQNEEWRRLKAGNMVISHDLLNVPFLPEMSRRHNWHSLVRVPLLSRGTLAGVLELVSQNGAWPNQPEEKRLLLSLGRQIGLALGNARLYEQEQQRARAWRGLVEISHKVASSLDKQQVFESLVAYSRELLNSEVAFVALFTEDENTLEMAACAGTRTSGFARLKLSRNKGLTEAVIASGSPVLVSNYSSDPRLQGPPTPQVVAEGIVSLLAVPLTAHEKVQGMLYVGERRQRNYTEADADLLTALATQAAIAVEKARLHEREMERVKEVERIKADFLAMITHELRTPLTNIKGITSGLLQADVEWDTGSQRAFLEAISEESDVLTGLVSNLLDMSKLEAGSWTIYLEECTFEEIVREVRRKLVGLLEGRELLVEVPPDLPRLKVDPTQIARVLVNLITNALKYCQKGPIYLGADYHDQDWLAVRVQDTGPGISAEDRPHIFDKFYQSKNIKPGLREAPGAGLGLAIVKGIVEAHGGQIWLADNPSGPDAAAGGSAFYFTLPLLKSETPD
jgi:signal transduction histidine kinase